MSSLIGSKGVGRSAANAPETLVAKEADVKRMSVAVTRHLRKHPADGVLFAIDYGRALEDLGFSVSPGDPKALGRELPRRWGQGQKNCTSVFAMARVRQLMFDCRWKISHLWRRKMCMTFPARLFSLTLCLRRAMRVSACWSS